MATRRGSLLAGLTGQVIDVGAGTGASFGHYPPAVERVVAVEPEHRLRQIAMAAAWIASVAVMVTDGLASDLAAPDASFDAAVVTFMLCTHHRPGTQPIGHAPACLQHAACHDAHARQAAGPRRLAAGGRRWQLGDRTPACLPAWLVVAARGDDGLWWRQAREGASGSAGRTESTSVFLALEETISFAPGTRIAGRQGDVMTNLPARPDIDQLRHRARDLLRAARSGDQAAAARIGAVADSMTLAAAQLAVAREHGFASWPRLKAEVEARSSDLAEQVDAFLEASIRDWTGRAARMLAATPQIAGYDFRTAVVLGDAGRVRQMLEHDQGRATRPDPRWGWTPLHAVCASRWHRLDPRRADGLLAVAGLLLAAGADPAARRAGGQGDWTPLRCAVAGAANPAIARLLLERGATPDDHDLYLACFADDGHQSLRLLLDHAHNVQHTTALAAPISTGDTEAVRLLLQAGADPSRPLPGDLFGDGVPSEPPIPPVAAAAQSGCPAELAGLLLDAGGDPDAPHQDGNSPYRIAIRQGRTDIADLLAQHGARDDTTDADRFLLACRQGNQADAERLLLATPGLPGLLGDDGHAGLVDAAGHGQAEAVRLMLDAGFPLDERGQDGATPLHAAALSGSAEVVRLLLDRGADIEARDTTWDSTPLNWAQVGSGLPHVDNTAPDWTATIRALIDAGASTADITLSADDPKPPSPEVAQLLRSYGIGAGQPRSHS